MTETSTTTTAPVALAYVRQSKAKDSEASPESQVQAAEAYAASQGWTLRGAHQDIGRSGWDPTVTREGWAALMAEVAAGGVSVVIVRDLSRLSRQGIREALRLVDELADHGVRLVSVAEPYLDASTPMGAAIFGMLAAFAKQESDLRSEKVTEAKETVRANGGAWQGGPVPYGLRVHKVKGEAPRLVVVPEEAEEVRQVAANLLAGSTVRGEVRRLNAAGLRTRRGSQWSHPGLVRLLRSVYLVGWTYDGDGEPLRGEDGLPVVAGEAVLDVATWRAVTARIDQGKGTGGVHERTLLAGRLRCGACGGSLSAHRSSDRARCTSSTCGRVAVKLSAVEAEAWRRTASRLAALDPEELAPFAEALRQERGEPSDAPERAELAAALAEVDEATDRLDDALTDGALTPERHARQVERLAERRRGLAARLEALGGSVVDLSTLLDPLAAGEAPGESLAALEEGPAVLRAAVERITVAPAERYARTFDPERLAFTWRA